MNRTPTLSCAVRCLLLTIMIAAIGCGETSTVTGDSQGEASPTESSASVSLDQQADATTAMTAAHVEVACGQCQFDMPGNGCDLAIRIDGVGYFVDGSGIDDHGDAHGDDGLCNCIREGEATGKIDGDRFVAKSIALKPTGVDDDASSANDN